jgi:hypothetical protein
MDAPKCHFSWDFQIKSPKIRTLATLKWGLKQSCSFHWKFSNDMWHAPCTHVIQSDSRLLMIGTQIDILTPNLSFNHNFYCKCSNRSYDHGIQWVLTLRESIGTPIPKVGVHLGVWAHSFTLLGMWMWFLHYTLGPHLSMPLPWLWAQG